jgi:NADPH-dependent glutamate synthase beta subunit-like oxidoreductase
MEKFKESIKTCLQHEPAFCTAACPFGLDIRDFIPKLQRGVLLTLRTGPT